MSRIKLAEKKSSKEAIETITSKQQEYVKYFKDVIIHDDNILVKAYPRFDTDMYLPGNVESSISTQGLIVKVGNNLDSKLVGKKLFWDAGRNPITMLNRIEIDEFKDSDIPLSEVFILIHKNIFTYIK